MWQNLSGGDCFRREPPAALLTRHAAALRLSAFAESQLLAAEALARGGWGTLLLATQRCNALRFVERIWRSELGRQQVWHLSRMQQDCLNRARDFLHPLDPSDADFLRVEDIDRQADLLR